MKLPGEGLEEESTDMHYERRHPAPGDIELKLVMEMKCWHHLIEISRRKFERFVKEKMSFLTKGRLISIRTYINGQIGHCHFSFKRCIASVIVFSLIITS